MSPAKNMQVTFVASHTAALSSLFSQKKLMIFVFLNNGMTGKIIFILFFTLVTQTIFAQHVHYPDKPSTHGMMLMGTEIIYASHLPMFHTPHDYQIILALIISDTDKIKYINDKLAHPEELIYTLEPEDFVLPEMVNYTKKFKANIYRGHFERGGIKIIGVFL